MLADRKGCHTRDYHNLPTSQYGRLANCQSGIVLTKKGAIHETRTATDP